MKKKLEAELLSIAHRILKLTGKSDLIQLHEETQRLYEKLSVLRFVEEHMADVKPTIGYAELEEKLDAIFDSKADASASAENKEAAISNIVSDVAENANSKADTATEAEEPEVDAASETEAPETEAEVASEAETASETEASETEASEPETEQPEAITEPETAPEAPSETEPEATQPEFEATPEVEPVAELESPEETVAPAEAAATAQAEGEETGHYPMPHPELDEKTTAQPEIPVAEDLFKPAFEWKEFQPKSEEPASEPAAGTPVEAKITPAQISFDDLLGESYKDPIFVKPEELQNEIPAPTPVAEATPEAPKETPVAPIEQAAAAAPKPEVIPITRSFQDTANVIPIHKSENLNDRAGKALIIGLNDRIAFMNHLFNNSSEDYNRVLSQLITLDSLADAQYFIENMVKPDYNNWAGKEEYEQRFMEILEKRFS